METQTKKGGEKPIKTVRKGAIAASIWKRQGPNGFEYFDFSLSRSWKAKSSGKEGYSPNFFHNNADELSQVVLEAASWIASQQASSQAQVFGATSA
ncbi:MAG: hypothetical protein KDB03_05010 [Planctomycetales bacterium]|nr:hypothetical protein [Planctomycetales bacterium]